MEIEWKIGMEDVSPGVSGKRKLVIDFSTRSEAECGNFEEILWKLSGKSEWKMFPLEYPENGSWL